MPPLHPNPAYVLAQLERAAAALAASTDPPARAAERVSRWQAILAGMEDGTLVIGSRTPVADVPAWVTLDVAPGGFATGALLAERPLLPAEHAVLATLPAGEGTDRGRLNRWLLSPEGRAELLSRLREGRARVELPEDAALPVVAWLLDRGEVAGALAIVEGILPFLDRLRFAPPPADTPRPTTPLVHREPASTVAAALAARTVPPEIARMRETLEVWQPLSDRFVALFLETVEGEPPRLVPADGGAPERVIGGWPCRVWPAGWADRALALLADARRLRALHPLSRRPDDPKSNLRRLWTLAERAVAAPGGALTDRDIGWVRRILAGCATHRGLPGSPAHVALRAEQAATVALPTHAALAKVVAARLAAVPPDAGVPDPAPFLVPVAPGESAAAPAGAAMPPSFAPRLERCVEAPVEELVARGAIPSAEVLAEVLPQVTAPVLAAGLPDPALAALHEDTYAAFRRRRTLLLLGYAHQVRFEELPWVAAMAAVRTPDAPREAARQALTRAAALSLRAFPHTLLPNPLLTELAALAKAAGVAVPWVEELAADIFMGAFTRKFVDAAQQACDLLRGSLYARYYDLPDELPSLRPASVRATLHLPPTADEVQAARVAGFAELCRARAVEAGVGGGVAANGAVIEQAQILTTHNLAALVGALPLREAVDVSALALRCATEVVATLARLDGTTPGTLGAVKNAAYAWRQMLFFLSLAPDPGPTIAHLDARLTASARGLAPRLRPALRGLTDVVSGERFDPAGLTPGGGRRLLGWGVGGHWIVG